MLNSSLTLADGAILTSGVSIQGELSSETHTYQFTTNGFGNVTILIDNTTGGLSMHLFDSEGNILGGSDSNFARETIVIERTLGKGTYYIRISPHNRDELTSAKYRLKASFLDKTPTVNPLYNHNTSITGNAVSNTKVYAVVGKEIIGETTAKNGKYNIKISAQKAGTKIGVYTVDSAGNISSTKSTTVINSSIQTVSTDYNKIKIGWAKVPGADGYEVYRSTTSDGKYSRVGTVTKCSTVSFTNSGVTTGRTYFYRVRAYRMIDGKKVYSPYTKHKSGKALLPVPTNIKTKNVTTSSAALTWKKVTGADGYEVYRANTKNGTFSKIGTLTKGSTLNYTNKNLTTGKTYHYKVRAYRTVNGKKVYSKFSETLKQKIPAPVVDRSLETLRLVDKQNGLPKNFVPKDLITPNVRFSTNVAERKKMTKEAGRALEKMFNDANKAGIVLYAQSGYRSYATQQSIYQSNVKRYGQKETDKFSAKPGHSEHQTGLAMDITSKSVNFNLTEKFADTKEGKWLIKNASKYGFIISYPKGKTHLTGYIYEPWHYRYVGVEHALFIDINNLTLKEYLDKYGK